jgi:hypothetical protein
MSERYNTPEQGTLDWHNPLNENFNKLDRDVEIRDQHANLENYDPNDGSKFLATDTGDVYLGDGSNWNQIGTVAPADTTSNTSTSSGEVSDGSVVASEGDVQSIMDDYATGDQWGPQPMQTVKLVSGATYNPSDTWFVPAGVRLHFNGAVIEPDGDFNIIEMDRNTEVHEPRINVSGVNFSSTCITMTASEAGKAGTPNPAHVYNCHLFNDETDGVGLQFRGGNNPSSMQRASGKIHNFDRGLEFRAAGGDTSSRGDWSNGNRFNGNINGSRIPIYVISEGGAAVGGNIVRAQVQAGDQTEWIIRQEDAPDDTNIRGNCYIIYPWDAFYVDNEYKSSSNRNPQRSPVWYIGTGQQEYNCMWDTSSRMSNEWIINRSTTGAGRNGIFNGAGQDASRGVIDFSHPSTFQDNDASFHPDS